MIALAIVAYVLVGALVGIRASCVLAWRLAVKRSGGRYVPERMEWWEPPGPFFLFWACLAAWPLVLTAFVLPLPSLTRPPREIRRQQALAAQKRLEREALRPTTDIYP